jgi:LuxR family maltose regulon positive regulatory protein
MTGSSGVEEAAPLAEAKLAAPRRRRNLVRRPRIVRMLDESAGAALTLVAAPAGYGKSTAVREWCACRGAALAWVTLDVGDNDLVRFWMYVATAVDRVREGLGRRALKRLGVPGAAIEIVVDELMNGMAAFGDELVLVLDDVHNVTDEECLASIDYALEHLPATVRLIVVTRTDPAVEIGRLRARGALGELRAEELAFTVVEARELLVGLGGIELDVGQVELLRERTEGWPAALFLAALWLRAVEDPGRAVVEFGGEHRFVVEYLSREALGSLDGDTRSFLLQAAVLGRFTAELCDGVLGRSDSALVLDELERSNLFVTRLEHGGWWRVHSLFAEFAGFELAAAKPGAAVELHRSAAAWFRSRGMAVETIEHAAAAGEHELVAQILLEHHLALIRSGGARTLLRWVRTLSGEQLLDHPELAVVGATAAAMVGHTTIEQRRLLAIASRAQAGRPESATPYVRAVAGMVRAVTVDGNVRDAIAEGRHAVEVARVSADEVLVAALGGYARALYFGGELDRAWAAALRAVEHPDAEHRAPGHAVARSTLALAAVDRGWLGSARAHAEKAKAIVGGVASSRSWLGANACAALGSVLEAEGDLVGAERELSYAEHFFRDEVATVHHAWLLVLLARIRCRRGRLEEAAATLHTARDELGELSDSGRVTTLAEEVERGLENANARAGNGAVLELPSEAELTVLRLLTSDLSTREIANQLFLSPNTVRSHTRAIYRKLGVNSREDAVARATALGLLGQAQSHM